MYLCCVESLNRFQSKLDFSRIFNVAQKSGQSPCTIVHDHWPNFRKNDFSIFIIFFDTYTCIYVV